MGNINGAHHQGLGGYPSRHTDRDLEGHTNALSERVNLGMATSNWAPVSHGNIPPYDVFNSPIERSRQDNRDYRLIRLHNGLHATLIHDAQADKAAASLDVAVGHLYDPDDMPGLAHFCEHLLFMGTEQYPRENDYSEFLAKNNGSSNAYTSTSNTNYYFSVATPALGPALSRFAAFFHSPLFSPSCTSRELNAVNSEHKKNHQSDAWRIFQLNKHLSTEGHVWSKFGSGNRESLSKAGRDLKARGKLNGNGPGNGPVTIPSIGSAVASPIPSRIPSPAPSEVSSANSETEPDGGSVGRETRRRLVEWWSKEYCASRMRLCVIGKEPLDELADLVSKLFSPIVNRGQDPLPMICEHPFGPKQRSTLVSVQTIMAFHAVEISFPLEYQPPRWRYKPASFISHFVGHEGPGSLHSYLKKKGWITSLNAGSQNLARGFAMFKVTMQLTKDGFQNYREVMLATFKYISMLRDSPLPAWYQRELATLSKTRFRFAEKRRPDDYAVWISEHMTWPVPCELIISAPQVAWEWDETVDGEKEVRDILECLRVDKGRAVLMARAEDHAKLCGGHSWQTEPWYGTMYRVEHFDEQFVLQAQSPNTILVLSLPGPNEFIPINLEVDKREVAEPLKRPHLIRETPLCSLWHKKDDQFWVPKAHIMTEIHTPLANCSPRNTVLTNLYTNLVTDSLTEFSYDADLAGLSYSVSTVARGISLSLSGYNDKMAVLARHVLKRVKRLKIEPERLEVIKEQLKRDWTNFFLGQTFRLSDYFGRYILTEQQWTIEESLEAMASVTAEELQNHVTVLLSNVHICMLVSGNVYKAEAIGIAEMIEQILGPKPLSEPVHDRALILPEASNFVWSTPVPNRNEPNSALTYYVHLGSISDQGLRVTQALLAQILTEPTFNVLRTKEQLGYVVSCGQWQLSGHNDGGIRILVQSEKRPGFLEQRVEAFLDGMKGVIEEMGAEEFEQQKASLEKKWMEATKNLKEDAGKHWMHISRGTLDFLRNENDAGVLKTISKQQVLSLFLDRVHPSSSSRSKLAVHMYSQKPLPKLVSPEASGAFEVLVKRAELGVDETAWRDEVGSDGLLVADEFERYWQGVLSVETVPKEVAQKLLLAIPSLVDKYPSEGQGEDNRMEGATYVDDLKAFKKSLKVSEDAPAVQWGDLPAAKF